MNQEFDHNIDRDGTMALKWDAVRAEFSREDVLPFWIADEEYAAPEVVTRALRERLEKPVYGYSDPDESYYDAVIRWYAKRHQIDIPRSWIQSTIGVVTAMSYAVKAFTEENDPVVLLSPVYGPFSKILRRNRRRIVSCPLKAEGGLYTIDFALVEEAFRLGAKMLLLCNPHNPVGRVWSREELSELLSLCRRYSVFVVSDEIHSDYTLFSNTYTSVMALAAPDQRWMACISPSKTFNVAGLCISNYVVPIEEDRARITTLLEGDMIMGPNCLGMYATEAAYRAGGDWLDRQKAYLEDNIRLFQGTIRSEMPDIGLFDHQGTFLLWSDFRIFGMSDKQLREVLGKEYGLAPSSGDEFGPEGFGFLRWNLACPREMVAQCLDRLKQFYLRYHP